MDRIAIMVAMLVSGSTPSLAGESDLRIHHQAALQKVREIVAPVCGAGGDFVCAIGVDWRPQHCALEYIVLVPPNRAREGDNAIWVGLDLHDRVVSVEPKRDLLCNGLRAG